MNVTLFKTRRRSFENMLVIFWSGSLCNILAAVDWLIKITEIVVVLTWQVLITIVIIFKKTVIIYFIMTKLPLA